MNTELWILLLLLLLLLLRRKRRRAAAVLQLKREGRLERMKELAKRFLGKEVSVLTLSSDSNVTGTLLEVSDTGLLLDARYGFSYEKRRPTAVSLSYVLSIHEEEPKKKRNA